MCSFHPPATPYTLNELVSHISPSHIALVHQVFTHSLYTYSLTLYVCVCSFSKHSCHSLVESTALQTVWIRLDTPKMTHFLFSTFPSPLSLLSSLHPSSHSPTGILWDPAFSGVPGGQLAGAELCQRHVLATQEELSG